MTAMRNSVNRREKGEKLRFSVRNRSRNISRAVTAGYRRILADAVRKKAIDHLVSASIEVAALMLRSSRTYFGLRLFHKMDSSGEMDPKIVATCMHLVREPCAVPRPD